jgi:predicted permease
MREIRHALHRLLRQPGFCMTVVLTLAICAAANLMVFAVLHSVLLRPLPYPEPDRLVTVFNRYLHAGLPRNPASVRDYFSRRGQIDAFESVSAFRYGTETHGQAGSAARRASLNITPEFFDTLGVALARGRGFEEATMDLGGPREMIVSYRFWQQQLGGAAEAVGATLELSGISRTVVGVLPENFSFLSTPVDFYLPLVSTLEQRGLNALHGEHADMLARLRPGATLDQALAQLEAHYAVSARGYPWAQEVAAAGFSINIAPLQADHVASVRPLLWLLQAGALGLLLIGAVNLMNLLLVRYSARAGELGIRRALGARSRDLLTQIGTESLLLGSAGAALGLLLAQQGLFLLRTFAVDALPLSDRIQLPPAMLLGATAAVLILSLLLALPIAIVSLRQTLPAMIGGQTRGGTGSRRAQRLRQGFSVLQIASAFLLLAGAASLGLSLRAALRSDPGFEPAGVTVAELALPQASYANAEARLAWAERVLEEGGARGGFEAIGFSTNVPVRGRSGVNDMQAMHVVGFTPQPGTSPLLHFRYGVAGEYFEAMGVPLLRGRLLDSTDTRGASRHVVVDEDFARQYWPDGDALGRRLFDGPDAREPNEAFTVVGVVGAVRQTELGEDARNGAIYFPYRHLPHAEVFVSVRSHADAGAEAALRSLIAGLDPALAVDRIGSMQSRIDATLVRQRVPALLASGFSVTAMLLAGLGCFGVLSYGVALRRREFGLRMAVGARRGEILRQVLRTGLGLLAMGCTLGLVLAWLLSAALQSLLPGLPAVGADSLLLSLGLLALVSFIASLLPARRAASIPPTVAMAAD